MGGGRARAGVAWNRAWPIALDFEAFTDDLLGNLVGYLAENARQNTGNLPGLPLKSSD